jgi:hypothetical protein
LKNPAVVEIQKTWRSRRVNGGVERKIGSQRLVRSSISPSGDVVDCIVSSGSFAPREFEIGHRTLSEPPSVAANP